MISFFRSMFQSRIGVIVTLGFVGLIALAFASSDITGTGFGGVAGGDRAATVGDTTIGTAELNQTVSSAFNRAREQDPTLTMQRFIAQGGVDEVLDSMIDRYAIAEFGREHGLVASDALVGSEIVKIPAFQGPDGRFSEAAYRQVLAQQQLSDKAVRGDLAQGLVAKQVLVPAAFGATAPTALALRYAQLARERRTGDIALIPSSAFAPTAPPSDAALAEFYKANRAAYTQPERRTLRYATFGEEAMKNRRGPTEAEIARAYEADKAKYAASETRTVTQVIVPTEAAARALAAEVAGGKALDAAARAKGLLPSQAAVTRSQLAAQSSGAVADAVFKTAQGALAPPTKGPLGWHVGRVDGITQKPAQSLADVRSEIVAALDAKLRRDALSDLTAGLEEQFDGGANLGDAARELGVTLTTTAPLTADGQVFGRPGQTAPPELARVLQTAFLMDSENQPQLAEIEPGQTFLIFDVAEITSSAPPPLAQIRARVTADWAKAQGAIRAKAVADKALAALAKGGTMDAALTGAGATSATRQSIDLGRQELVQQGQRVPPPLALLFSMAERTAKKLEAPGREGWYVIRLADIEPGRVEPGDPGLPALTRELGGLAGREYADQLRTALRREVGSEKNAAAIRAVRSRLTGGN